MFNKITAGIILALSVFLGVALNSFFAACPIHPEKMIMGCHWVANVVTSLSVISFILGFIHIFSKNADFKLGLSVAILTISILAVLVPGTLISICPHIHMRCHVYTEPVIHIVFGIILVVSVIDILVNRKLKKNVHK